MSNALAIASVTAVLKDLLNDGLVNANIDAIGQFAVTSLPLDRVSDQDADPVNRLNIYMWHATRNAAWSNQRLPARHADGARIDSPYLALDLHFVLTATGAAELNAEILLGFGMQVLHETPVLTRDAIRLSLGGGAGPVNATLLPAAHQFIIASDLADQFEQIRITPGVPDGEGPMHLEGISNLWSAFSAPLRSSALYLVSCVLIESNTPVRSSLPVLTLGDRTAQLRAPQITMVRAMPNGPLALPDGLAPVLPGSWVALDGTALASERMRIRLGGQVLPFDPQNVTNARIAVQLPADVQAGLAAMQVEHLFLPEAGPPERLWEMSNAAPLVVAPILNAVVVNRTGPAGPTFTGDVTVTLDHPVAAEQIAALLLNPLPGGAELAFSVRCRARDLLGNEVVADIRGVAAGNYLIRVEIGGAASQLTMGAGGFDGPVVDLDP